VVHQIRRSARRSSQQQTRLAVDTQSKLFRVVGARDAVGRLADFLHGRNEPGRRSPPWFCSFTVPTGSKWIGSLWIGRARRSLPDGVAGAKRESAGLRPHASSEFKPSTQGLRDQRAGAVRGSEQAMPDGSDAVVYSIAKFSWYASPQAANQAPNTSQSLQYVNYSR
jgi:hypothetical protein